jgi:hypothetical protein
MTVEFECGAIAKNIGAVGLACRAHIGQCNNQTCQAEVIAEAKKAGLLNNPNQ